MLAPILLAATGVWLALAPTLAFTHTRAAALGDRVVGVLLVLVAVASLRAPRVALLGLLLAAYVVIMPIVHRYVGSAHEVHDLAIGILAAVLAYVSARRRVPTVTT